MNDKDKVETPESIKKSLANACKDAQSQKLVKVQVEIGEPKLDTGDIAFGYSVFYCGPIGVAESALEAGPRVVTARLNTPVQEYYFESDGSIIEKSNMLGEQMVSQANDVGTNRADDFIEMHVFRQY
jgi:hypothetical protein